MNPQNTMIPIVGPHFLSGSCSTQRRLPDIRCGLTQLRRHCVQQAAEVDNLAVEGLRVFPLHDIGWVALTELKLSYHNSDTITCTKGPICGNLRKIMNSNPFQKDCI